MDVGIVPYVMVVALYTLVDRLAFRRSGAPTTRDRDEWTYYAVVIPYMACLILPGVEILIGTARPSPAGMVAGAILVAAAMLLRWLGVTTLARSFSAGVETHRDHALVDHGVFAVIRHPLYLGLVLLYAGLALFAGATWSWAVVAVAIVGVAVRARVEERWLAENLPGYQEYARRTKRFIPGVW